MHKYTLHIHLLSDATFGRGDGVAGVLDQEVEHDAYGFPYLRGRTLKGLLSEECDTLLAAMDHRDGARWQPVRDRLFGIPGSQTATHASLHVGDAQVAGDVRSAVAQEGMLQPTDVLGALTTIRRQTSIDHASGVAQDHSLRSARVIIRGTTFSSLIASEDHLSAAEEALLGVSCLALRRVGSGRNRGRGAVRCLLLADDRDITATAVATFMDEVQ